MSVYRQWFVKWIFIALVGITGWSCAEYQSVSKNEKKTLEVALKDWGNQEKKTCDIIDASEEKDFTMFKHEFSISYGALIDAHTEFDEARAAIKDQKLRVASKNCSVEMARIEEDIGLIYAYYEDYQASRALTDENSLVVDEGAAVDWQEAHKRYINQKRRYIKQRSEARRQILKSGVL